MKVVNKYCCSFCDKDFALNEEDECLNHENNLCIKNPNINWNWFRVKKEYRNGGSVYFVALMNDELSVDILNWIGENAPDMGGMCYGWEVTSDPCLKSEIIKESILEIPDYYKEKI